MEKRAQDSKRSEGSGRRNAAASFSGTACSSVSAAAPSSAHAGARCRPRLPEPLTTDDDFNTEVAHRFVPPDPGLHSGEGQDPPLPVECRLPMAVSASRGCESTPVVPLLAVRSVQGLPSADLGMASRGRWGRVSTRFVVMHCARRAFSKERCFPVCHAGVVPSRLEGRRASRTGPESAQRCFASRLL